MSTFALHPVMIAIATMLYIIAPFAPPVLAILMGWPTNSNRWWRHLLFAPAAVFVEFITLAPWLSLNWSDATRENSGFVWGLILHLLSTAATIFLYYVALGVRVIIRALRRCLLS